MIAGKGAYREGISAQVEINKHKSVKQALQAGSIRTGKVIRSMSKEELKTAIRQITTRYDGLTGWSRNDDLEYTRLVQQLRYVEKCMSK